MQFETVKPGTRKFEDLKERARNFEGYSVRDCYGKCSYAKMDIEEDIKKDAFELGCYNYHICSFSKFVFTCAFEDPQYLYYITPAHAYKLAK